MNDRPLVTFALIAYKQERFIRDAVEGALSQTYSPLEIIFSDDCSTDRTFNIMRETASQYVGPHKILLNRNEVNLGIAGHINRIMEMARGELIVGAAGDDISLPNRSEELVRYWLENGRRFSSMSSGYIYIDQAGRETSGPKIRIYDRPLDIQMLANFERGVEGWSEAWTSDVFRLFGPILPETIYEDNVIAMRSCLMDGRGICPKVLMKYRLHGANIHTINGKSKDLILKEKCEHQRRILNICDNYRRDMARAISLGLIDSKSLDLAALALEHRTRTAQRKIKFLEGDFNTRISLIAGDMLKNPVEAILNTAIMVFPHLWYKTGKNTLIGKLAERIGCAVARFR